MVVDGEGVVDLGERHGPGADGDAGEQREYKKGSEDGEAEEPAAAHRGQARIEGPGGEAVGHRGFDGDRFGAAAQQRGAGADGSGAGGVAGDQSEPLFAEASSGASFTESAVPPQHRGGGEDSGGAEHEAVGLATAVGVTEGVDHEDADGEGQSDECEVEEFGGDATCPGGWGCRWGGITVGGGGHVRGVLLGSDREWNCGLGVRLRNPMSGREGCPRIGRREGVAHRTPR